MTKDLQDSASKKAIEGLGSVVNESLVTKGSQANSFAWVKTIASHRFKQNRLAKQGLDLVTDGLDLAMKVGPSRGSSRNFLFMEFPLHPQGPYPSMASRSFISYSP